MDIKIFVSKKGQVALACYEGGFSGVVEKVTLDCSDMCLYVKLKESDKPVMLNCPVDPYLAARIGNHPTCAMGYYVSNTLIGTFLTPFQVTNRALLATDMIIKERHKHDETGKQISL